MIFIFCTAMFLSMAFAFACLARRRVEETMAPAAFLVIIVLYISGICQNLMIGEYLVAGLSVAALLYTAYAVFIRRDKDKIRLIVTPGLFCFLLFFAVNAVLCRGRMLTGWDEFSHWGRVIFNMYRWDKLGNCAGSTVMLPGYPPAVALWQYFFVCLKGDFSEAYLYEAHNLLAFVLLLPAWKKTDWKHWTKPFVLLTVSFLMPLVFYSNFWSSIYVDGMLGIWMIYILYAHFSEKENTRYKVLQIVLALCLYPIVKAAGSGLAFLTLFVIAADMLLISSKKADGRRKVGVLLVYALSILVGKQVWEWYLKFTDTPEAWHTSGVTLQNIFSLLRGEGQEWQYTAVWNFIGAFFRGSNGTHINVFLWILGILCLALLLYVLKIWDRKQLICYSISFVFCIGAYAGSLLALYCFTFSEYEGMRLASFDRYMSSVLLGILGFFIVVWASEVSKVSETFMGIIAMCILVPFDSIETYTVNLQAIKQSGREMRNSYEHIKEFAEFMDWNKDRVYLVDQGSNGHLHVIGGYVATPIRFSDQWGWSLGEPLFDGDVWTVDYSLEEWEGKLRDDEYTYVYIEHQDEQFVNGYGALFEDRDEIKDRGLYQVYPDDSGGVVLKLYKEY